MCASCVCSVAGDYTHSVLVMAMVRFGVVNVIGHVSVSVDG